MMNRKNIVFGTGPLGLWVARLLAEHDKYRERFGDVSTPHDIAIEETVAWHRSRRH